MGKLDGKVTIIVGSTSGMGEASARLFAKEGATVIVTGRRENLGKEIAESINADGGKADFFKLDCSVLQECYDVVDYTIEKYGKLDILLYNSGVSVLKNPEDGTLENSTVEEWDYLMDVNTKNAFFMSKYALPYIKETKGNLLYTSSGAGIDAIVPQHTIIYAMTKAALNHMVRLLAYNVAPDGVRVNAICPGLTNTPIIAQAPQEVVDQVTASIPLRKMAQPEDMAKTLLFLASDDACSITGRTIPVDNGQFISC